MERLCLTISYSDIHLTNCPLFNLYNIVTRRKPTHIVYTSSIPTTSTKPNSPTPSQKSHIPYATLRPCSWLLSHAFITPASSHETALFAPLLQESLEASGARAGPLGLRAMQLMSFITRLADDPRGLFGVIVHDFVSSLLFVINNITHSGGMVCWSTIVSLLLPDSFEG